MAFTVSTKKDKNDKNPTKTLVTVVYDNSEAERALATQALIVKAQGNWRSNGIPASATLKMSEWAPGSRHGGPVSKEQAVAILKAELAAMTPEQKVAKLRELGLA